MRNQLGVLGVVGVLAILFPARAAEDAPVHDIVSRAFKAHGGIDAMKKHQGSVAKSKGKIYLFGDGADFTGETSTQLPDRLRTDVTLSVGGQDISFVQVIDGGKGWMKLADDTKELKGDILTEAKEQMNAGNITHLICLKEKGYKLSTLGEVKVGDRAAVGVRVEREGYRDVNLFFDKEKHLLVKLETRGKNLMTEGEEFTAVTLYEDYKKVDGIMVAHKVTVKRDDKLFVEATVTEVKLSEKLEDNLFEKP